MKDEEPNGSIAPAGTRIFFASFSQHFVLGYFHCVPDGRMRIRNLQHAILYLATCPYPTAAVERRMISLGANIFR
jgi:hypothetical protein